MRAGPVPSPCVSICRIDPSSGLCVGCLPTLDEIAAWGSLADDTKRDIWTEIERRRSAGAGAARPSVSRRDAAA